MFSPPANNKRHSRKLILSPSSAMSFVIFDKFQKLLFNFLNVFAFHAEFLFLVKQYYDHGSIRIVTRTVYLIGVLGAMYQASNFLYRFIEYDHLSSYNLSNMYDY